jgi:hypothetical protein
MIDVTCSSQTSADFNRITCSYNPGQRTLYNHRCENLKSYILILSSHLRLGLLTKTDTQVTHTLYITYSFVKIEEIRAGRLRSRTWSTFKFTIVCSVEAIILPATETDTNVYVSK